MWASRRGVSCGVDSRVNHQDEDVFGTIAVLVECVFCSDDSCVNHRDEDVFGMRIVLCGDDSRVNHQDEGASRVGRAPCSWQEGGGPAPGEGGPALILLEMQKSSKVRGHDLFGMPRRVSVCASPPGCSCALPRLSRAPPPTLRISFVCV